MVVFPDPDFRGPSLNPAVTGNKTGARQSHQGPGPTSVALLNQSLRLREWDYTDSGCLKFREGACARVCVYVCVRALGLRLPRVTKRQEGMFAKQPNPVHVP